jgi:hypothetical protein
MLGRFCSGGDDILQEEEQVRYDMSMCCIIAIGSIQKKVSTPHPANFDATHHHNLFAVYFLDISL